GQALARKLADATADAGDRRSLAVSFSRLGKVYLRLGDTKAAVEAYRRHHEITQQLADADPADAGARRDLAVSYERLGGAELARGDTRAALKAYQKYHQLARDLA